MISILLLGGVATADLVFVVFDNNVLMCVEDMLAIFTIFFRMQLTHEAYNSNETLFKLSKTIFFYKFWIFQVNIQSSYPTKADHLKLEPPDESPRRSDATKRRKKNTNCEI